MHLLWIADLIKRKQSVTLQEHNLCNIPYMVCILLDEYISLSACAWCRIYVHLFIMVYWRLISFLKIWDTYSDSCVRIYFATKLNWYKLHYIGELSLIHASYLPRDYSILASEIDLHKQLPFLSIFFWQVYWLPLFLYVHHNWICKYTSLE